MRIIGAASFIQLCSQSVWNCCLIYKRQRRCLGMTSRYIQSAGLGCVYQALESGVDDQKGQNQTTTNKPKKWSDDRRQRAASPAEVKRGGGEDDGMALNEVPWGNWSKGSKLKLMPYQRNAITGLFGDCIHDVERVVEHIATIPYSLWLLLTAQLLFN